MKAFFIKYRFLFFLFFLAVSIRLPMLLRMNYADFPEYYRDYHMAQRVIHGPLPLYGPPSMQANFHFGPVYYYFLAPLMLISNGHPASLLLTSIIFYALSGIAFYKLLRLWFKNEAVAKFGSLFYTVSIYGIQLNSYVSNPNFLPLWVILFFIFLTKILTDGKNLKNYFYLGSVYSVAAQMHLTAALVLPAAAILPIITERKQLFAFTQKLKAFWLLFFGLLLPTLPYLIAEVKTRFNGFLSLLAFSQQTMQAKNSFLALGVLEDFFQGSLNPFFMGSSYSYIQPIWLYYFISAAMVLLIISFIIAVRRGKFSLRGPKKIISDIGLYVCIGWLFWETLLLITFNKSPHSYYLIVL